MILRIFGHDFQYECENLCREYFPNEKITVIRGEGGDDSKTVETRVVPTEKGSRVEVGVRIDGESRFLKSDVEASEDVLSEKTKLETARLIFFALSDATGYRPPWGVLTGVRPSKLALRLERELGESAAKEYLNKELLVSEEKVGLLTRATEAEKKIIGLSRKNSFSLYVSIPFCPTRCDYCSFVSHSIESPGAKRLLPEYLEKLSEEIAASGKIARELGLRLETVYFGGGTPGILEAPRLDALLGTVEESFDLSTVREYTVEVGRPDVAAPEKFEVLRRRGVDRICVNPQTFNQKTLDIIGRKHDVKRFYEAYDLAGKYGFKSVNTDLIAGLPGETADDFKFSLDSAAELSPENITVHSLALKRSSKLNENGYGVPRGDAVKIMLEYASKKLSGAGYFPYYMYRQSKSAGNFENVGWCAEGKECLYNAFMIQETHMVLAAGAGAVTKLCNPDSGETKRIFNYKYPYEYISGFGEITKRKNGIKSFYLSY